jgi:hypothetical protein
MLLSFQLGHLEARRQQPLEYFPPNWCLDVFRNGKAIRYILMETLGATMDTSNNAVTGGGPSGPNGSDFLVSLCEIEDKLWDFLKRQRPVWYSRHPFRSVREFQLRKHVEMTLSLLTELRYLFETKSKPLADSCEQLSATVPLTKLNLKPLRELASNIKEDTQPETVEEWENTLKRWLLWLKRDDADYLYSRLLYELRISWAALGDPTRSELEDLKSSYGKDANQSKEFTSRAFRALQAVHDLGIDEERVRRTRLSARGRYLNLLSGVMAILLFALWGCMVWNIIQEPWPPQIGTRAGEFARGRYWMSSELFITPLVGALGAVLAHMRLVREEMTRSRQILAQALWAQVFTGASAALVLLLVLKSSLNPLNMSVEGWSTTAVVGFLAGYSEAFFLNTVGRLAGLTERTQGPS